MPPGQSPSSIYPDLYFRDIFIPNLLIFAGFIVGCLLTACVPCLCQDQKLDSEIELKDFDKGKVKDVVTLNEDAEKAESDSESKTEESYIEDDDVKDDPADSDPGDADGDLSGKHDGKCYMVNPKKTQGLNVLYMYTFNMSLIESQSQILYIDGVRTLIQYIL